MAFLFRNKNKSGPELAKLLKESLQRLDTEDNASTKAREIYRGRIDHCADLPQTNDDVSKVLSQLKSLVQGTQGTLVHRHVSAKTALTSVRHRS